MTQALWFDEVTAEETAGTLVQIFAHLKRLTGLTVLRIPQDTTPNRFDSDLPVRLNTAPLCFFTLSDDPDRCSAILHMSLKHPGIIMLRERALHTLCRSALDDRGPGSFCAAMRRWYGPAGERAARVQNDDLTTLASVFPLFEVALHRALGVIVGDPALAAEIDERLPGLPVLVLRGLERQSAEGREDNDLDAAGDATVLAAWLGPRGRSLFKQWAHRALIETAARHQAACMPLRFPPRLPAGLAEHRATSPICRGSD